MEHNLFLISGLSGTGKTTLGKYIASKHNATFVDQDSYYKKNKPLITLSNGTTVKNWDCVEAIDWNLMIKDIMSLLEDTDVILVGFALRPKELNILSTKVKYHVELIYGNNDIDYCKQSRCQAKKIDCVQDSLIVDEVVWPFYLETRKKIHPNVVIPVYHNNIRKSIQQLYEEYINNIKK